MIDPKLARGYARQVMRPMDAAGRAVRTANFRAALHLASESRYDRKIKTSAFNVAAGPLYKRAQASPATVAARFDRASLGRHGVFSCASVMSRDIVRLRGPGQDFAVREWGIASDNIVLRSGHLFFTFVDAPVLFDRHVTERFVLRMQDKTAQGLLQAVGESVGLALVQLQDAKRRRRTSQSIVLPAEEGAFVGLAEPILCRDVGRCFLRMKGRLTGMGMNAKGEPSNVMLAAGLRTYLSRPQMNPWQQDIVDQLAEWNKARRTGKLFESESDLDLDGPSALEREFRRIREDIDVAFAGRWHEEDGARGYTFEEIEDMADRHARKWDEEHENVAAAAGIGGVGTMEFVDYLTRQGACFGRAARDYSGEPSSEMCVAAPDIVEASLGM